MLESFLILFRRHWLLDIDGKMDIPTYARLKAYMYWRKREARKSCNVTCTEEKHTCLYSSLTDYQRTLHLFVDYTKLSTIVKSFVPWNKEETYPDALVYNLIDSNYSFYKYLLSNGKIILNNLEHTHLSGLLRSAIEEASIPIEYKLRF